MKRVLNILGITLLVFGIFVLCVCGYVPNRLLVEKRISIFEYYIVSGILFFTMILAIIGATYVLKTAKDWDKS